MAKQNNIPPQDSSLPCGESRSDDTASRANPHASLLIVRWAILVVLSATIPGCSRLPGPLKPIEKPPVLLLAGEGAMAEDGTLIISLAKSLECERVIIEFECRESRDGNICGEVKPVPRKERVASCDSTIDTLSVTPPWEGPTLTVAVDQQKSATFIIDWEASALDLESADILKALQAPWEVSSDSNIRPFRWSPSERDVAIMLRAIGHASGEENSADESLDTRPAEVVVVGVQTEGATLQAGGENVLRLTVKNNGPGTAYGVKATTKSSHSRLHGREFAFGRIQPGADATQSIDVTLAPSSKRSRELIMFFIEWKRGRILEHEARVTVDPTPKKPKLPELSLSCKVQGQARGRKSKVHPGQDISLWCLVANNGKASARSVTITAEAAGKTFSKALKNRIRRARSAGTSVKLRVPSDPSLIGSDLVINASVMAKGLSRPTRFTLKVPIQKRSRCPGGLIPRHEYNRKRAGMQDVLEAGGMTQEDFDRLDALLVGCIKTGS